MQRHLRNRHPAGLRRKDDEHPDGALDDATVEGMRAGLAQDPPGFDEFTRNFFSWRPEGHRGAAPEAVKPWLSRPTSTPAWVHPVMGGGLRDLAVWSRPSSSW